MRCFREAAAAHSNYSKIETTIISGKRKASFFHHYRTAVVSQMHILSRPPFRYR